jgi:hypothetical protein
MLEMGGMDRILTRAPGMGKAKRAGAANPTAGQRDAGRTTQAAGGPAMHGLLQRLFAPAPAQAAPCSVICVYNDAAKLERFLLPSLKRQSAPHELLLVDNTAGAHPAAAPILNATAARAAHGWLLFVHQDVALSSDDWLAQATACAAGLPRLGAAGSAGRTRFFLRASVSQGHPPCFIGPRRLSRPARVQNLDGCLLLTPKDVFERVGGFDGKTARGWYFFVLDYCLRLRRLGLASWVLPQPVYHESEGPGDPARYADTLARIRAAHRDHVRTIYSTMGTWRTRD